MKKYAGHIIKSIKEDSIAEQLELEAGDILLKINGEKMEDVFDYQYMTEDEELEILIRKKNGEEWVLEIEKEYGQELGMEFEEGLMDEYRSCCNKCIFCFIDQMPKGMRETLYFKDDDSRLSFLQGNYITLTNMSDREIERIIRYHLYPINISVQTTNPQLRCEMLHNRFAGEALKKIDRLAQAAIEMNGQVVLCKGVNDGEELKRTIDDLSKYLPHMRSVSVVPAGLTKYREGLYPLEPFTKEDAEQVIDLIESYQSRFYESYGLHFIHASDEWYILAGRDFPEEERYDGYIQLENGVGMMRLLRDEFMEALQTRGAGDDRVRSISLATGKLAAPMLRELAAEFQKKYPGVCINIYEIRNDFFGELITVSGLLTGTDLMAQLKGRELGEVLLLPCNVLRMGEEVFLDDVTLEELKTTLQVEVNIVKSGGDDLFAAFLGEENQPQGTETGAGFVYQKCYPDEINGGIYE